MLDKAASEKIAKRLPDEVTVKDEDIAIDYAYAVEAAKKVASVYAEYLAEMKKKTEESAKRRGGEEYQYHSFGLVNDWKAFWKKHAGKFQDAPFIPMKEYESTYDERVGRTFEEMSKAGVTPDYLERILTLQAEEGGAWKAWRKEVISATDEELKMMGKKIWPRVIGYRGTKQHPITASMSRIYADSLNVDGKTSYDNTPEFYNALTDYILWSLMTSDWRGEMRRRKLKVGK